MHKPIYILHYLQLLYILRSCTNIKRSVEISHSEIFKFVEMAYDAILYVSVSKLLEMRLVNLPLES